MVRVDPPPPADDRLPIFSHPNVGSLFEELQLWVDPDYTRYRHAWKRTFGAASIEGKVLHHVYNRRTARLRGFGFIRLVPVSRGANSSSAFSEQWGVDLHTLEYIERLSRRGQRIQYADLADLMVILDMPLGGGVMEAVLLSHNLVEVNARPDQSRTIDGWVTNRRRPIL